MLYDAASPTSIETYGKKMIGKTFREIFEHPINSSIFGTTETMAAYGESHAQKNYKGGIGTLVEECYFGYKANSDAQADFPEAGVELKVTPYKKTTRGIAAKERLVLTMINYLEVVKEQDFEHSHLWAKAQLMLLVWYLHDKNNLNSTVDYVQLFTPPPDDLAIIISDYNKIINKIKAGKAHELSEGDTLYLGACTKSASSKNRRQQPFSDIEAKPRAFSLKNSYMTYVLNNYIIPGKVTYEPILKDKDTDFESYVTSKIAEYKGKTTSELCQIFGIANLKTKNLESMLAFRILGLKGNQAAEFAKAGIAVKSIRVTNKGTIKENMSFPAIKYDELATETWDDCTFGNYLRDTRFFFVIYQEDEANQLHLDRCMFWNIPYADLEGNVRKVWQEMHDIVADGNIQLNINAKGIISNNFPKIKDNPISHVRPHAQTRMDVSMLPKGTKLNITAEKENSWPYEDRFTKHCFWLNNTYILSQITQ